MQRLSVLKVVLCCCLSHSIPNSLCVVGGECRCGNVRACSGPRSCVKGLISFCVFTVSVLLGNILGGDVSSCHFQFCSSSLNQADFHCHSELFCVGCVLLMIDEMFVDSRSNLTFLIGDLCQ